MTILLFNTKYVTYYNFILHIKFVNVSGNIAAINCLCRFTYVEDAAILNKLIFERNALGR